MSRKKPPDHVGPPLDWLRRSVWAGEELPEELELIEDIEPERPAPKRKPAAVTAKRPANRKPKKA